MKKYEDFLSEFDKTYKELQEHLGDKNYSGAGNIEGYLLGMIRAAQILCANETNLDFAKELRDRIILLA